MSQLNRTTQTQRQPGSAIKPLTYLAALQAGLQPNTLIRDQPITFPPIGSRRSGRDNIAGERRPARRGGLLVAAQFRHGSGGFYTLRRGLENSRNIITARLLDGGIADTGRSLDRVCALALEARIYPDCVRYYPFVLGAQPVHMIDLAAFYAAVANEGARPAPHGIDFIEDGGRTVYKYPTTPLIRIGSADRTSFYQLKTILQGVVARGTARSIAELSPYVAGKTGTTEDSVDAWFVGFTNDVPSPSGSATTTATANAARSATAPPARAWRCRSLLRSSKRSGRTKSRPKRRSAAPRRRRDAISSICRSIT